MLLGGAPGVPVGPRLGCEEGQKLGFLLGDWVGSAPSSDTFAPVASISSLTKLLNGSV